MDSETVDKLCSVLGVPKELLERNSTIINSDKQAEIFKMHYLCEWVETSCPKCGSKDIQVTEKATGCNDCGWDDCA